MRAGVYKRDAAAQVGVGINSIEETYLAMYGERPPRDGHRERAARADRIVALGRAGKSVTAIGRELHVERRTVRTALTAAGVTPRDGRANR